MNPVAPSELAIRLAPLGLGPIEYHPAATSTNDLAASRLESGAPDLTLIIADEQTRGRGRLGRTWFTPPGAALAFSLVLHADAKGPIWPHAALGALAVHQALADLGLPAEIKWPNDVLLAGKKVCGVLAEAHWRGDRLHGIILGIGVNILPEAVPPAPAFPATSVAGELGRPADRWELLAGVLRALLGWRSRISDPVFLQAWEARLAFRGQVVRAGEVSGVLVGLAAEGALRLQTGDGFLTVPNGEVSLRPIDPVSG